MFNKRALWAVCLAALLGAWFGTASAWAQDDVDFEENYRAGKEMISQNLYVDAVRLLYPAVFKTSRGKTHFGANYYLGMAYYHIGSITQAVKCLKAARMAARKRSQRELLGMLFSKINKNFGELLVVSEAGADSPKVLKLALTPQKDFTDPIQRKSFYIISNLWKKKGITFANTRSLWLPKGEYFLQIPQPMCLTYAFAIGGAIMSDLTIGENSVSISLKDMPSCKCLGGQTLRKEGKKRYCTCPDGKTWMAKRKRCMVAQVTDNRGWFAKNWPWVTVVGVVVVGAAVAIPVGLMVAQNSDRDVDFAKTDLFLRRRLPR
ncbi:MAG: hypothetical protein H6727_05295 [Myxococcales bacterium]|nr:hypothetical protein [Myxococcales bacterium]